MSNQQKSREAANSWRKTNPTNLPSVPAPRYLLFQRVLMEINPSLTPSGMANMRREEWGEARTAERGEQSTLGVPACTEMWWNRPKQDVAGLYWLPSSSAGPPSSGGHPRAGRVLPPMFNLEEANSSPGFLKSYFKVPSIHTGLQQAPERDLFLPLGNAKAC